MPVKLVVVMVVVNVVRLSVIAGRPAGSGPRSCLTSDSQDSIRVTATASSMLFSMLASGSDASQCCRPSWGTGFRKRQLGS